MILGCTGSMACWDRKNDHSTVDRNADENRLVAGFFFSRDDATCSDHALVFLPLMFQLARLHPMIKKPLVSVLREGGDWRSLAVSTQYKKLVSEPLKALETAGHPRLAILFILDALDECASDTDASNILRQILSDTSAYSCNLRISVTSRPEGTVERLIALAGNLFNFAATAVQFNRNVHVRNPQRQLDIVLGSRGASGESVLQSGFLVLASARQCSSEGR